MGINPNIGFDKFPRQGTWLHRTVMVVFNYDLSHQVRGKIVREDVEAPGKLIIQLDDGRFVLATECQYSLIATEVH